MTLDIVQLVRLRRTCRVMFRIAIIVFTLRLRHILKPFIEYPDKLRTALRETQSIIGGSTAILFLLNEPLLGPPADLNLYTGYPDADTMIEHLSVVQGCEIIDVLEHADNAIDPNQPLRYLRNGARKIILFSSNTALISLTISDKIDAAYPLLFTPNSGIVTYLSADGFLCAYAAMLFNHHLMLNPKTSLARVQAESFEIDSFMKYTDRGFSVFLHCQTPNVPYIYRPWCTTYNSYVCPHRPRYLGDAGCLFDNFKDPGHRHYKPNVGEQLTVRWVWGGSPCNSGLCQGRFPSDTVLRKTGIRDAEVGCSGCGAYTTMAQLILPDSYFLVRSPCMRCSDDRDLDDTPECAVAHITHLSLGTLPS